MTERRQKLLLNDVHLGVLRSGGTTPESAWKLREYLLESLRTMMLKHPDKDIIVNGDLFDTFNVPMTDVLAFFRIACEWLAATNGVHVRPKLVLGRGNHDWSKDSAKLSSFDFVGHILRAVAPDRVVVVTEPQMIFDGIYMIPHMPNQDLFDLELGRVPTEAKGVLVHANYDNHFAVEADHSLNVSEEQAKKVVENGAMLVFGHEHQARIALHGRVMVTGNQWPSSIADCLGNPDGLKHAHVIDGLLIHPVETWRADDDFALIDWREIDSCPPVRFVRASGSAPAAEAHHVIEAVAKFRRSSDAFVIANDVKIEGVEEMADLSASLEQVQAFDVMKYLLEQLDEKQAKVVSDLIANDERRLQEAA